MILLNALKLFRRILVLVGPRRLGLTYKEPIMAFPSQNAFIIRGVNNNLIYIYIYKESNFNVIIKYICVYGAKTGKWLHA